MTQPELSNGVRIRELFPLEMQHNALYEAERELRNEILLRPIGVPDHAWEMHDHHARHWVALDAQGSVIGCVLLALHEDAKKANEGQLMQMAVRESWQGKKVGYALVEALVEGARELGLDAVYCHARASVIPFYSKTFFEPYGPRFFEVEVEHQRMRRVLEAR